MPIYIIAFAGKNIAVVYFNTKSITLSDIHLLV